MLDDTNGAAIAPTEKKNSSEAFNSTTKSSGQKSFGPGTQTLLAEASQPCRLKPED